MRLIAALSCAAIASFLVLGSTAHADGVTGTATITKTDDGYSHVVVEVTGLEPNTEHMNHIHVGPSCENPGDHLVSLENLVADAQGNATATTEARADDAGQPVTFDSVTNGSRILVIHAGPDGSTEANKQHLACGVISASNGADEVQVAIEPETGGMPSTGSGPTSAGDNTTLAIAVASVLATAGLTSASVALALAKRSRN